MARPATPVQNTQTTYFLGRHVLFRTLELDKLLGLLLFAVYRSGAKY
jgi:hypothetical protein